MKLYPVLSVSGIWLGCALSIGAQAPNNAATQQAIRNAQWQQSHIAVQSLTEEILAVDKDIERRVDQLVGMMVEVTDSVDSGRKIANQKEDLMQGLKKTMDFYLRERQLRQADLNARYQRVPVEALEHGVKVLDEKIDRRVEQIMEVSASLAGHQDVQKYERGYDSWDDGWWDDGVRQVSREWRHNQRVTGKTSRAQENIMGGLENDRQRLQRENDDLRRRIQSTPDPAARARMQEQIARNEETIARREDQRIEAVTSSSTSGRTVSSREATTLDRLMRDMVEEIQHDFRRLQSLVNQRNVELQRIQQMGGF